ncbi:unnamed protein product [Rotaria sp. Silwood1]|nr:unnamed protein product [Rotaria sp. Silwood1]
MDIVWYHNDSRIFFTPQSRIHAKQIDCYYKLLLDDIEYDDQGLYEMRYGIRILPSERIVYSVKGDLLTLTIHNAQIEDEENYRCMVDNQHTDATLTVEPLPAIFVRYLPKAWTVYGLRYSLYILHEVQPGRYTIRIDDIHGQESSCQVSVEDLAEIERKKLRIIRGLEDLNLHEGELLELECQFESRFIIKEVYLEDAGLYKLRLKNKYGKVSTSCLVSVRQREPLTDQRKLSIEYLTLKFIEPISDVYVHEEQETHFRAIISGQPSSKVTCFCNYKKIAVGTENIAPSFIRKLCNCTVIEGQREKFDCFITGQPNPTIRWLHNVTLTVEDCLPEDAEELTIIMKNRAAHHEASRLKRRVSFDVPELPSPTIKRGAIPLPSSRLLLTPHSKSNTSIQLRGLNLNHIYAVRVRAKNIFDVSGPSQPVTSRLLTRADEKRVEEEQEPISKTKRPPTSTLDEYDTRPSLQVDGPDIQYFLEGQKLGVPIPFDDSRIKLYNDRRGYAYLSIDSTLASDEDAYETLLKINMVTGSLSNVADFQDIHHQASNRNKKKRYFKHVRCLYSPVCLILSLLALLLLGTGIAAMLVILIGIPKTTITATTATTTTATTATTTTSTTTKTTTTSTATTTTETTTTTFNIGVLLSNGTGTFAAQVTYSTGVDPYSVAAADVNGDSKLDIIVTNYGSNNVGVLLNTGTGTFAAQVTYSTGSGPYSVAAADVNGDSTVDIIVGNDVSNNIGVLLNNGNGTFAAQVTYSTGSNPRSVVAADVNGDSKLDIIVANMNSNNVGVLLNNGNGTFAAQVTYSTGSNPYPVAAVDVSGDSKVDIIVANGGSNNVGVLLAACN